MRRATGALLVGLATTVVLLAVAILPFLSPVWVGFEQGRAQAAAWTGFTPDDLRTATDAILSDLVLGPPEFDVEIGGVPVLNPRERDHMRDVRGVFMAFYLAAAVAALVLLATFAIARGRGRAALWRRISRTGLTVAAVTVIGGLVALASFDTAFQTFHEVFFPQGNFLFDPRTERLVQLFPEAFWVESSTAVGVVVVALGLWLGWFGRRRAAAVERRSAGTPASLHSVPVR